MPIESETTKSLVFVYGTLKTGHSNNGFLNGAKFIGPAIVDGAKLTNVGYYPGLLKADDSHSVLGEVWQVDSYGLMALDFLEGYPTLYTREEFDVEIYNDDNEASIKTKAIAYIYNDAQFASDVEPPSDIAPRVLTIPEYESETTIYYWGYPNIEEAYDEVLMG